MFSGKQSLLSDSGPLNKMIRNCVGNFKINNYGLESNGNSIIYLINVHVHSYFKLSLI